MGDLRRENRITARSTPEVVESMERALSRFANSRRVMFRGRKLSNEAFVNAAILHLVGLPEGEQEAALAAAIRRLESILSGPGDGDAGDAPAPEGESRIARDADADEARPARRRRGGA